MSIKMSKCFGWVKTYQCMGLKLKALPINIYKSKKFKIICYKMIVFKIILSSKMNQIAKAGANHSENEEESKCKN